MTYENKEGVNVFLVVPYLGDIVALESLEKLQPCAGSRDLRRRVLGSCNLPCLSTKEVGIKNAETRAQDDLHNLSRIPISTVTPWIEKILAERLVYSKDCAIRT